MSFFGFTYGYSYLKIVALVALTALCYLFSPYLKPSFVKALQVLPISSKWIGPPKGLIKPEEMVEKGEASLVFQSEPSHLIYKSVLPSMVSRIDQPAAFILSIPNGRVYSEKGVVISPVSDCILSSTAAEFETIAENSPVFRRVSLGPCIKIPGRTAVLASVGQRCYYHWMFDVLPKIALLNSRNITPDHYLTAALDRSCMKESLELLGVLDRVKTCKPRAHYECEELIFPSRPAENFTSYVPVWVYKWLREQFSSWRQSEKSYPKFIFISRSKASIRHLINENEVLEKLKPYGFVCCRPEEMSLRDQVALFSQVEMVVAPHGAGLTNLVFSEPGTTVVELFPSVEAVMPCYAALCEKLELNYHSILSKQTPLPNNHFCVDSDEVLKKVQENFKK